LLPSHHTLVMLCDTFFKLIIWESGWSNSPNALLSTTRVPYFSISLSHSSFE
jgi:hypothetical protein